jgi:hypothetical protein
MERFKLFPNGTRWRLEGEGPDRTLCAFTSKAEALRRCAEITGFRPHVVTVFAEDGSVEEERTYPYPLPR